ncbi:hypothetical protein WICPIJ_007541 [Wickerhamomyces pijperi]|uniref:Uncharacterized protein n=1 Tax=Wickerhamomyces pijperi TaxID=599730 RepID=A0A9P8Q1K2_WICPI|nr:hypothetical protein WICPIJ_007541 [Wickerhamomyces pijperi]
MVSYAILILSYSAVALASLSLSFLHLVSSDCSLMFMSSDLYVTSDKDSSRSLILLCFLCNKEFTISFSCLELDNCSSNSSRLLVTSSEDFLSSWFWFLSLICSSFKASISWCKDSMTLEEPVRGFLKGEELDVESDMKEPDDFTGENSLNGFLMRLS